MIIGLDLDNTIVCYDAAIEHLASDMESLPPDAPKTKLGVRDYLRAEGREPEWTEFQGKLYGPGMAHAAPFPACLLYTSPSPRDGLLSRMPSSA